MCSSDLVSSIPPASFDRAAYDRPCGTSNQHWMGHLLFGADKHVPTQRPVYPGPGSTDGLCPNAPFGLPVKRSGRGSMVQAVRIGPYFAFGVVLLRKLMK